MSGIRRMSGEYCYNCGRPSHCARDCRSDPGGSGVGGFSGRDRGSKMDFRNVINNCNRPGHFERECRMDQDRCYKCNQLGHIAKECEKDIDSGACYNCKSPGHVERDCPEMSSRPCYRCGENGHLARDCPGGRGHDEWNCNGCGGVEHISRKCPTAQRKKRLCHICGGDHLSCPLNRKNPCCNCNQMGHIPIHCPLVFLGCQELPDRSSMM